MTKPVREAELFDSLAAVLEAKATPVGEPMPMPAPLPAEGANGHILVVEDNVINQKVATAVLKQIGYTADVAADGLEAIAALEHASYDVILMDCQMPRMDGYEATIEIRRREIGMRTPIVAMTASAMSSDRDKCLEVGMDDYLAKPIDRDALEAMLATYKARVSGG